MSKFHEHELVEKIISSHQIVSLINKVIKSVVGVVDKE